MSSGTTDTEIHPPLMLSSPKAVDWAAEADVIVVGWGAAGACAALQAREQGASVMVVDRFEGGGASALSGGVVYAGGGTRQQLQAGYHDSPQAMFDYLTQEVRGVVRDDTLMRFCEQSKSQLEWLESHGVAFDSTMPATKTSYPPDGCYLYFSGNETVPAYAGAAAPAPRGHRVVALGQSGAALYSAWRSGVWIPHRLRAARTRA